jgi:opine dehydrogenase
MNNWKEFHIMHEPFTAAILGAGNGAHAIAGHLALKGFTVHLYNKFEEEIVQLRKQGGVTVEGAVEGFGRLELVTTDIASALDGARVIMVVVPAFVHRFIAEVCAPHLQDGQIVVLNPGRTGGALEFVNVLREKGVTAQVKVAEAQTLIYACRIVGPARVQINSIKRQVPVAAFPATDTGAVLAVARQLLPEFVPAANVLETGFNNIGAIFHPSTTLFNASRIEASEEFEFYSSITPMVAGFLEAVDSERVATAKAYGVEVDSARNWLAKAYEGIRGDSLYERLQSCAAYRGIKGPKSLHVRYIFEDVPTGLVPIASFAQAAGISTPASRSIVDMACVMYGRDFWTEGRNMANLGLAGMEVERILDYVSRGQ